MRDSLEKTMTYLFLMDNKDSDIYKLNRSVVKYFYSLPLQIRKNMDISYFWEVVLNEWSVRQKSKNRNSTKILFDLNI
jgi:hypothetical protein